MDDVTIRWIFGGVIGAGLAINGWTWRRVGKLEDQQNHHKDRVNERYVPRDDLYRELGRIDVRIDNVEGTVKDAMDRVEKQIGSMGDKIDHQLGRIYNKLDMKADK